jgi:hypothetical protein
MCPPGSIRAIGPWPGPLGVGRIVGLGGAIYSTIDSQPKVAVTAEIAALL